MKMVLKAVSLVESSLKKVASPQILSLPQPWLLVGGLPLQQVKAEGLWSGMLYT